jgi:hypothetical protein
MTKMEASIVIFRTADATVDGRPLAHAGRSGAGVALGGLIARFVAIAVVVFGASDALVVGCLVGVVIVITIVIAIGLTDRRKRRPLGQTRLECVAASLNICACGLLTGTKCFKTGFGLGLSLILALDGVRELRFCGGEFGVCSGGGGGGVVGATAHEGKQCVAS